MKYIVIPNKEEMIYKLVDKVDGFILGLDNFSVNLPTYFSLDKIEELITYLNDKNKEIFISLNKNIHNNQLNELSNILIKLNNYKVKIMYYDIAIVNLTKKLNLNYELVWSQEHLTTNYHTINFWKDYGVNYTLLSNELTKNEIINIRKNTDVKLMYLSFGYVPIFTSYRHLIDNYINTFDLQKQSDNFKLYKEGNYYKIIDDKLGTTVYNRSVINCVDIMDGLIDYAVISSLYIEDGLFYKIIDMMNNKMYDKINELIESNTGFLFKETVYKVK